MSTQELRLDCVYKYSRQLPSKITSRSIMPSTVNFAFGWTWIVFKLPLAFRIEGSQDDRYSTNRSREDPDRVNLNIDFGSPARKAKQLDCVDHLLPSG